MHARASCPAATTGKGHRDRRRTRRARLLLLAAAASSWAPARRQRRCVRSASKRSALAGQTRRRRGRPCPPSWSAMLLPRDHAPEGLQLCNSAANAAGTIALVERSRDEVRESPKSRIRITRRKPTQTRSAASTHQAHCASQRKNVQLVLGPAKGFCPTFRTRKKNAKK